jgi:hypothetical protein
VSLPAGQVDTVCLLGHGALCCSFLTYDKGWACGKGTPWEDLLRKRHEADLMVAKGNNCSGPPDFTPLPRSIEHG